MYAFQVSGQAFEVDSQSKDTEEHSYTTGSLVHNPEKDMVPHSPQHYSISPAAVSGSICMRDVNKASLCVPTRRPCSTTVEGNLCCSADAQGTDVLHEVGNVDSSTEMPPPPTSFHPLSHPHHGLDLHSVVSLTSSHVHNQEAHPHIEMVGNPPAPYTDTVYKSFLFIDDCIQISQEHNKQKIIQDSSKVYSKVET
jgi:hypothetical protein